MRVNIISWYSTVYLAVKADVHYVCQFMHDGPFIMSPEIVLFGYCSHKT